MSSSSSLDGGVRLQRKAKSEDRMGPRQSIWGFTNPLTVRWFFSVIGSEYCHTYFWIAKDLAWMQSWRHSSISFGILALTWSSLILYHSLRTLNWHELWNFVSLFLWLFANFWWMLGEAHDYEYPDEKPIAAAHAYSSSRILQTALCWGLFYYLIIVPFNLLPCHAAALLEYDDGVLQSRLPCFKNFRQYENLHMVFWIAKDLAWNQLLMGMWLGSMIFTILLAIDFIIISSTTASDDRAVDVVHFAVILLWVVGNSVWAYGDFFMPLDYNEPMGMWTNATEAFLTARWYSSWILFTAIVPIFIMYGVWGTLTLLGKLQPASNAPSNMLDCQPIPTELDEIILDEHCRMCRDRNSSGSDLSPGNSPRLTMAYLHSTTGSLRAASSQLVMIDSENPSRRDLSPSSSVSDLSALVRVLQHNESSGSTLGVIQRNVGSNAANSNGNSINMNNSNNNNNNNNGSGGGSSSSGIMNAGDGSGGSGGGGTGGMSTTAHGFGLAHGNSGHVSATNGSNGHGSSPNGGYSSSHHASSTDGNGRSGTIWMRIARGLTWLTRERSNDKVTPMTSPTTFEAEELAAGLEADEFDELLPHRD